MAEELSLLAAAKWRIRSSAADASAKIVRPDLSRRGVWIGPLATVPLGSWQYSIDEDNDAEADLRCEDGRNLFAIAAVPQFARLVEWALAEIEQLNPIHFDSANQSGRFMRELRNRCEWLSELITTRKDSIPEGDHRLMSFDEAYPTELDRIR